MRGKFDIGHLWAMYGMCYYIGAIPDVLLLSAT